MTTDGTDNTDAAGMLTTEWHGRARKERRFDVDKEQVIVDAGSEAEPLNQIERLGVLLVIAAILIYVLMAFLGPRPGESVAQGNVAAAKAQIKQFDTALTAYKIKFKELPDRLEQLLAPPEGKAIMNAREVPLDPWDTPYLYMKLDAISYVTVSLGADGEAGGDDEDADIRSDEITNEVAQ